jgi:hypothetical protein
MKAVQPSFRPQRRRHESEGPFRHQKPCLTAAPSAVLADTDVPGASLRMSRSAESRRDAVFTRVLNELEALSEADLRAALEASP